ncbi:MAG: pitrilysin family protein [Candidatus Binatia bacterium]|nr:pitrilysin family protein [Candidatus Binatia bacterium]
MNARSTIATLTVASILGAPGFSLGAGPKVTRISLDNGIRLVLSEQPAVPIVTIDCLVDGGTRVDPRSRPGLAALTGALLEEGTKGRSGQDISKQIDSLGGSFSTGTASDWVSVGASVLARDFETGLDLVARSLEEPTFPEEAVERLRTETLGELQASQEHPGYIASRGFRKALFGNAPYGHPAHGTAESVKAIKRSEIVAYHQNWIVPERTICAIVGDVKPDRMEQLARKKLGSWKGGKSPAEPAPAKAPPATDVLLDMPTTQANIVIGQMGVDRKNPDFFSIRLMNHILGGGGFQSRLMDTVRDENGLAYSVSSRFGSNRFPGAFQVVLQTKVQSAKAAIDLVREEIQKIHESGVTAEELEAARDYLTGNFPLNLDSTSKLTGFLAQIEYFDLGDDYIETYGDRIRGVTAKDVGDAAQKYLHPDALVQIVVGPEADLASQGLETAP